MPMLLQYISLCSKLAYGGRSKIGKILLCSLWMRMPPYGYNFPVLRAIKVLNKKEGKNVLRKIESFHGTPYCP